MKASIIANPHKDAGYQTAARAAAILLQAGVTVLARQDALMALPAGVLAASQDELFGADFIVTLGGDGTILAAANGAAGRAPLLGVNMGRKGFLTEVEPQGMEEALMRAARGDYRIESRMMLEAGIYDETGAIQCSSLALNDFFLAGAVSPQLVHVEALVDGCLAGKYAADGLLVSSPTGSTGYALSAGGPVVSPEVRCMMLTPVCAHMLNTVPLVIPADAVVTLRAAKPSLQARIIGDGEERSRLLPGWRAEVRMADRDALFVRFGRNDFYGLLRDKLVEWID